METTTKATETQAVPTPEHEHFTKTREGQTVWSTRDECIVCGTGRDWR